METIYLGTLFKVEERELISTLTDVADIEKLPGWDHIAILQRSGDLNSVAAELECLAIIPHHSKNNKYIKIWSTLFIMKNAN